jgi:hypothetical protein
VLVAPVPRLCPSTIRHLNERATAAAGFACRAETVQLYTAGPTRLRGVHLGDLTQSGGHDGFTDHRRRRAHDLVGERAQRRRMLSEDLMAAGSRWDGSTVSAQNVRKLK